ncbi:MAG: hypothetical protein J5818_05155, partial [Eggerthellaceae bacterium]|nr:hypothetical protein [Eggerthellaceae bacterium]
MVRIAPVRLSFNPRTLWFEAGDLDLHVNDKVVVSTARGDEFGTVSSALFDMKPEDEELLKSPLKPVKRLATDEDCARNDELLEQGMLALPIFKQIAAESIPDMNPIAVEYLFSGDKAVFYFESEERVDFRDLVKKLASEFHVRVDMKQIGVRDEARLIGGIGHCGQELCCRRLGGGFDPVSIRMAKEQDLSLNPQKISGICGRLMCCLRYEYDAYKDFHGRAPKKNAKIQTPDGEGKVVDMNVPREIISVKVGDEKPVRIPLADFEETEEGERPHEVGEEAWARANEPTVLGVESALNLFSSQLPAEDKLAEPGTVRHVGKADEPKKQTRTRRRSNSNAKAEEHEETPQKETRKPRRRRSTTVASDGTMQVTEAKSDETKSQQNDQKTR